MFQHSVALDTYWQIIFLKVCSTKYILLKKRKYFLPEFEMYTIIEVQAIHSMDAEGKNVNVDEDPVRE